MALTRYRWALIAVLTFATMWWHTAASDALGDADDLRAASGRMSRAIESGALDVIEETLSADWKMFMTLPTRQTQYDRESWISAYTRMLEGGTRVRFDVRTHDWSVGTDMAWYRAKEAVRWVGENEAEPLATALWLTTHVWERREGRWMLVHSHHSFVSED